MEGREEPEGSVEEEANNKGTPTGVEEEETLEAQDEVVGTFVCSVDDEHAMGSMMCGGRDTLHNIFIDSRFF